jgi:hypothetical protein
MPTLAPSFRLAVPLALLLVAGCAATSVGPPTPDQAAVAAAGAGSPAGVRPTPSPAKSPDPRPAPTLGEKPATAVEVCDPEGERAYLRCLACPDGSTPTFRRLGSFGDRPKAIPPEDASAPGRARPAPAPSGDHEGHIVDGYAVGCGEKGLVLFFDMYHCDPVTCREVADAFSNYTCEAPKNPGVPKGFHAFPDCLELLFSSGR